MSNVIVTVGLDLAKNVFQVHGVDADGRVCVRRKLRRSEVAAFFFRVVALPDRDGGVRVVALLGPRDWPAGSRGQAHAAGLRKALC